MIVATKLGPGVDYARGTHYHPSHPLYSTGTVQLVLRTSVSLIVFAFLEFRKFEIKIKKTKNKFFIRVADETLNLAPMYLQVRWRIQGYVVLGRKYFVVVQFQRKLFCPNKMKKYCLSKTVRGRGVFITTKWIFILTFTEKYHLAHSHLCGRRCFASS